MSKTTKIIIGVIILVILFALVYYRVQQKQAAMEPIRIGAILPLGGKNAVYGEEIRNAIELAREEINSTGGVKGRKLEVIYEDDQTDPKLGVAAIHKLINVNKVKVILGPWASGVVLAIAPVAEQNKVIVMAEALAPAITYAGDYIFRIQPSAIYYTKKGMPIIIGKLGLKTFAILYINNEFGVALRNALKEEVERLGGTILIEEKYNPGENDFRTYLTKIKLKMPDVLFIGGYQEQTEIIKQASELGIRAKILAGPPFESRANIESLKELAEGVIYFSHFVAETKNPKAIDFLVKYKKKFGIDAGSYSPLMYDAVHILSRALRKCGENTDCIKTELYQTKYEGATGFITFDQNGDPLTSVFLKTVKNGKFVKLEENGNIEKNFLIFQ